MSLFRTPLLVVSTTCCFLWVTPQLAAQKKKDDKDAAPQIVVAQPMAVEMGKTTKITLRGLKVDAVTELRIHEPRSTGKLIGKAKKIPVPNNTNPNQVGDSEIEIEVTLPTEVPGSVVPISVVGPSGESKTHQLIVKDGSPIVAEKEPNDGFKQAQPIAMPCVVEGSIQQAQDVDVFRFEGKQGDQLIFELQANRFGAPVDGILNLYDEGGRQIATADDSPNSVDPILRVTLPKSGTYFLSLIDAHDQGGSIFLYRLLARPAK